MRNTYPEKNKSSQSQKLSRGAGAKHVYETLRQEILTLQLAPGVPLDETSLAERFVMSRSPIREALVRLSADGLVDMLSNRSTLVAPVKLEEFPRYVEALDFLQRINTRLAAKNRTDEDLAEMTRLALEFEAACEAEDHLLISATNRDFHTSIGAAGRNPYLAKAYERLLDDGRRILHLHIDYIRQSDKNNLLTQAHFDLIKAIAAQDVDLADRLAHEHTRQFHDGFRGFLKAEYAQDFRFELEVE